jgi:hypothetical protein
MLTDDDLRSFRGQTISEAEVRDQQGQQVLRLHLAGGGVLAISADTGVGVDVADQSSDTFR